MPADTGIDCNQPSVACNSDARAWPLGEVVKRYISLKRVTGSKPRTSTENFCQGARLRGKGLPAEVGGCNSPWAKHEVRRRRSSRIERRCGARLNDCRDVWRIRAGITLGEHRGIRAGQRIGLRMGMPPEQSNPIDTF